MQPLLYTCQLALALLFTAAATTTAFAQEGESDPCSVITGGMILSSNGTNEVDVCSYDIIEVNAQYEVNANLAYVLADANYEILEIVTDPKDVTFADYDTTRFNIFALTYTGTLNTDATGSVYLPRYSSECWQITDNEIIVRIKDDGCDREELDCSSITGGMILGSNGTNEVDVCSYDVIEVLPQYEVNANLAYVLADANYEILDITTDPWSVTFADYDTTRFNIFALTYTGALDSTVTGSVYTQRYSDECWQITDNEIIVRIKDDGCDREELDCSSITGGMILGSNGTNEVDVCSYDIIEVLPQYEVNANLAYVLADANYEILDITTDPWSVTFADYDTTRFNIFALTYTGALDSTVTGSVYTQRYSDACWQITDNEIIVRIKDDGCDREDPCDVITGGLIFTDNETNEIDVCQDEVITVVPSFEVNANLAYVLADANYEILEITTEPSEVNFGAYDTTLFNVFTVVYTGNLNTDLSGSVYTPRYSDECWQISDNEIIVRVTSEGCEEEVACTAAAGTLAPADSSYTLDEDGVRLTSTVAEAPVVPEGYEVVYVLTYPGNDGDLVIGDIYANREDAFVTEANDYRLHTLVAELSDPTDPDFLDASVVVPGETTAQAVLGLVADAGICVALELPGAMFPVTEPTVEEPTCEAAAGTLVPADESYVLGEGGVRLTTEVATAPVVPEGYEVVYVLTYPGNDGDLIIGDIYGSADAAFVTEANDYRVHTLVAELSDPTDPDFLDASVVVPGETTAQAVLGLVADAGLCVALELPGAMFSVAARTREAGGISVPDNSTDVPAFALDLEVRQFLPGGAVQVVLTPAGDAEHVSGGATVTLVDGSGRVVDHRSLGDVNAETSISLTPRNQGQGLHAVSVQTDRGVVTRRVIVQ